jgi:hypothetical protein
MGRTLQSRSRSSSVAPYRAVGPAIAVIRRTGALPGYHRDAERPLGRTARAESGASRGLAFAAQHEAADAFRFLLGRCLDFPEPELCVVVEIGVREPETALRDLPDTAPTAWDDLEHLADDVLRRPVSFAANRSAVLVLDLPATVGKGYHTEEKVVGFYNIGDRIKFWGKWGAFWGGLWGLFFGGLFMTIPIVGHIIVLGYLAAVAISAVESAVVVGGLSALGAALYSIGVPKDSVIQYETALEADSFLVMAHGTAEKMARAKAILNTVNPSRLDVHAGAKAIEPADHPVHASD